MATQDNISPLNLNQGLLQDFVECPRRFQLNVIDGLPWPAAYTAQLTQFDRSLILGNRFHLISHQFFSGIDRQAIERSIEDPILMEMFQSFIPYAESFLPLPTFSEQLLVCSLLQHKLIAKFDLIVETNHSNFLIIDWKTSSIKPNRNNLSSRIQTILYPYILHQSGHLLFGGRVIDADSIVFHYWYPLCEEPEVIFPYSNQIHQEVYEKLLDIITRINQFSLSSKIFPLTEDQSYCNYCKYRSLCDRGINPGEFEKYIPIEQEDLSNYRFDLGNIDEVIF